MNYDFGKDISRKGKNWLEYHWATPAYGGWVLIGIAISFFGAATNTMAGWLYVLSGMLLSLLGLNFVIAIQTLKHIQVKRLPIRPVSAEDELTLDIIIKNPTKKPKTLIQVTDKIPPSLGEEIKHSLEVIPPEAEIQLTTYISTKKRGIYHWQDITLSSAAPFGLFCCSRNRYTEGKAVVYPQVLPLQTCPLVDNIGDEESRKKESNRLYINATEGVTKALRQYRYGDPIRLIHWRTSARFGDLQVRELETITGGQDIIICLDNSSQWQEENFEKAIIAIASMYFYSSKQQLEVKLWLSDLGIIHGSQVILQTLAGVDYGVKMSQEIPHSPVIWVSQNTHHLSSLARGSRWLLFSEKNANSGNFDLSSSHLGIVYDEEMSLQGLLQKPL